MYVSNDSDIICVVESRFYSNTYPGFAEEVSSAVAKGGPFC